MKWLYVYLPHFYAESCIDNFHGNTPIAITNDCNIIVDYNSRAEHYGICQSMSLQNAYCLAPALVAHTKSTSQTNRAQQRIAKLASRFSSWISIDGDQGVFLEIASMRRLFSSTQNLHKQLQNCFLNHGYTALAAAAPFAATAQLLAQTGRHHAISQQQINDTLESIALCDTPLASSIQFRLLRSGVRYLGELRQLPKQSLNSRGGEQAIHFLDRVYGDKTWLPTPYKPKPFFTCKLDLEQDFETLLPLRFILAKKLTAFCQFLHKRALVSQSLYLTFFCRDGQSYQERLALACPDNQNSTWHYRLNLDIGRWQLPAPIYQIKLHAIEFEDKSTTTCDLFAQARRDQQEHIYQLFNRINAKLGDSKLNFIHTTDDPRPENSTHHCSAQNTYKYNHTSRLSIPQPVWLTRQKAPEQHMSLLYGPARLHSGWWDNDHTPYDYRVTYDDQHVVRWICRDTNNYVYQAGIFG